jgi:monothiol glutaredoxin
VSRPLLPATSTTPAVAQAQTRVHAATVDAVRAAVGAHPVVVVGMGWNPHVRWARQALDAAGIAHHDLDYGNYLTGWKPRLAIKLWSGWPTFPQVFVRGTLVGGNADVRRMIADGSLRALLDNASP